MSATGWMQFKRVGRDGVWPYLASALVVALCCGLIVPSVLAVGRTRAAMSLAVAAQQVAGLSTATVDLLRAVQVEEGRSEMSRNAEPVVDLQLQSARQQTDLAASSWLARTTALPSGLLDAPTGQVRRQLVELVASRQEVTGSARPLGGQTDLVSSLVELSARTAAELERSGVGSASSYLSLVLVIQKLDQERSRIAGMLAAEPVSSRAVESDVEADVAARVQALELLTLLDPSVSGNFLTDIAASPAARSVADIEQAVLRGDSALLATVEAERWFAQATAVSGEYHALLAMRTAAVQVRADRLVSEARSELRWEVAATAFMLVGALIFGLGLLAFARNRISNGAHRFARQSQIDAARIEAILSTASDAIITMDENAFIQACNPAVESVYGYLPAELVGQRLSILMPDDASARSDGRLDEYLRVSGENLIGTPWESVCRRKDGSEAPVEVMSTRVVIGGRTMITSIARDISERKRALENLVRRDLEVSKQNEALARSNAELQQFASVASHDLQEPLRKVTSYLQVLEADFAEGLDEQAREYMRLACSAADRMRLLINDLLCLSRIREETMHVDTCDTRAIVDAIIDDFEIVLRESGAVVKVGDLPVLPGDRGHLRQVFQNIISNAVKYRGAQPPRIDISARCDSDGWHFTLRDNGIGFRQEYAEQIFGMFKRLVNRRDYEGTGIGLAVVAKIIGNHGGRIWATSELGVGTTIEFVLPDAVVQPPARIPAPRSGSASELAAR